MERNISLFLACIILLTVAGVFQAAAETGELITDTIHSSSLEGNLLGDPATRNMVIYLPPSYNTSDKRYPVVYLLHMHALPGGNRTGVWRACGLG